MAAFGVRPIANALGMCVSMTATFGLGMSAWTHRRSMIPCSCGASCGVTSWAPIARSAISSEAKNWNASRATATTAIVIPLAPAANSTTTKIEVDEREQRQREQHAGLKTGVASE